MSERYEDGPKACMICGRPLDHWSEDGWQHSIASSDPEEFDHPPIAVSYAEAGEQLRGRCDFCYADNPMFELPCRDFIHLGSWAMGSWAACENCARLIERNEWTRLTRRSVASFEARHGYHVDVQIRTMIPSLHRLVRKNVSGGLRPIDWSHD